MVLFRLIKEDFIHTFLYFYAWTFFFFNKKLCVIQSKNNAYLCNDELWSSPSVHPSPESRLGPLDIFLLTDCIIKDGGQVGWFFSAHKEAIRRKKCLKLSILKLMCTLCTQTLFKKRKL